MTADFGDSKAAARLINDWVEDETHEKILDLVKPSLLSKDTRLVLVNAIYFKGNWSIKFDPKGTKKQDFHLTDGSIKKVPMMSLTEKFHLAYLKTLDATMLELPYKGDRLVMQLLLPGRKTTLAAVEDKMGTEDLQQLWTTRNRHAKVEVHLPRFKLEMTIPLKKQLSQLKMTDMFDHKKADFSRIDGKRDLFVSEVVQKAFIEVSGGRRRKVTRRMRRNGRLS